MIHIENILLTGRCLDANHYSLRDSFLAAGKSCLSVSYDLHGHSASLGADRYFLVNYDS